MSDWQPVEDPALTQKLSGEAAQPDHWQPIDSPEMMGLLEQNTRMPLPDLASPQMHFLDDAANQLNGARQGTNPYVAEYSAPLGEYQESEVGAEIVMDGKSRGAFDTQKHIVLQRNGQPIVFDRSDKTNEGRLLQAARTLAPGMMPSSIAATAKTAATKSRPVSQALDDFLTSRIDPTAAALSDGRSTHFLSRVLGNMPVSDGIMQRGNNRMVRQAGEAIDDMATTYGNGATQADEAGGALRRGGDWFVDEFKSTANRLYDHADSFFGADDKVPLSNTIKTLSEPMQQFENLPNVARTMIPERFQGFISDFSKLNDRSMPIDQLRKFRSYVGKQLGNGPIGDVPQAEWKKLYGALSRDLEAAARAKGPEAYQAHKQAADFYSAGRERIDGALKFIFRETNSNEGLFQEIVTASKNTGRRADVKKLRQIKGSMPDEEWGTVVAVTLRKMGEKQDDFNITQFSNNWGKMSDKAKDIMFGSVKSDHRKSLDAFARSVDRIAESQRFENGSNTASHLMNAGTLAGVAWDTGKTVLGLAAGTLGAAAMTSPKLVRWMHQATLPQINASKTALAAHIGRLRTLGNHASQQEAQMIYRLADEVEAHQDNIVPVKLENAQ